MIVILSFFMSPPCMDLSVKRLFFRLSREPYFPMCAMLRGPRSNIDESDSCLYRRVPDKLY